MPGRLRSGTPTWRWRAIRSTLALTLGAVSPVAAWGQLPSVISAAPATVRLVVGGAPVTVTLSGVRLDHASSVRVLLADSPIPPVTAELGPPHGPTQRTVVLQAGPAAPVGTYVVQMLVGSRVVPIPLSLTVVRHLSSAPVPVSPAGL